MNSTKFQNGIWMLLRTYFFSLTSSPKVSNKKVGRLAKYRIKRFYPTVKSKQTPFGIYSGEVGDDQLPHGEGRLTYKNGRIFEGTFYKGFKKHGKLSDPETGDYYKGDWSNDLMHGFGTIRSKALFYEGEFHFGKIQGSGIGKLRSNKGVYSGKWVGNRFVEGTCTLENGEIFEGQFNQTFEPHGEVKYSNSDGETFEGTFENGYPIKGKRVYKDQTITVCFYKDGRPHGIGYLSRVGYPEELGVFKEGKFTPGIKPEDLKVE